MAAAAAMATAATGQIERKREMEIWQTKRFAVCCYYCFECQCHKHCVAAVVTLASYIWYVLDCTVIACHIRQMERTKTALNWEYWWLYTIEEYIYNAEILLITLRGSKSTRLKLNRMNQMHGIWTMANQPNDFSDGLSSWRRAQLKLFPPAQGNQKKKGEKKYKKKYSDGAGLSQLNENGLEFIQKTTSAHIYSFALNHNIQFAITRHIEYTWTNDC